MYSAPNTERRITVIEKSAREVTQIEFSLQIVVEPDGDGFHAYSPVLKGLHACGETEREALENAKDAATAYLCSLIKHGDPIPVGFTNSREQSVKSRLIRRGAREYEEKLSVACA